MKRSSIKEQERIALFEDLFRSSKIISLEASELLSLAAKFQKIETLYLEKHKQNLIHKKIAILASYTTHHFMGILRLFLYQQGIAPIFYEGGYDTITAELMHEDSDLFSFKPDIVLMLTHHNDIKDYPPLFSSEEDINNWAKNKVDYYENLWRMARKIEGCHIFQTHFVIPIERQLGNLEANYLFSPSNCIRLLNLELIRRRSPYITFIDMRYIASLVGKEKWFDYQGYLLSKQGFSIDVVGWVSHFISRILSSFVGKIKKCLVLDLDNTLWGGIIGDDGLEGINANPNDPLGEAFINFQKYLKKLKNRGVILAVNTKNEEDMAKVPFLNHPDMHLRLDDFACFVANWSDKATNLKQIARQLNIGLDAMVFFDDSPAERELVRQFLPEVEVIEVPQDPALYIPALERAMCFEWIQLSKEDLARSTSYILDARRQELKMQCIDYDSYLRSLEMTAIVGLVCQIEIPRFTQLINKSNQFNLRTRRYSEARIDEIQQKPDEYALIYISLSDKFGNFGIISSVIIQKIKNIAFIDTWVMSCRVLKRGVEDVVFNIILETAKKWGCNWIIGEYLPTKKNKMVSGFYQDLGFKPCPDDFFSRTEEGGIVYRFKVPGSSTRQHFIKVERL